MFRNTLRRIAAKIVQPGYEPIRADSVITPAYEPERFEPGAPLPERDMLKRRDAWLKIIGATDPETPEYHAALADWELAREHLAARDAERAAPTLIAEAEAFLAEAVEP